VREFDRWILLEIAAFAIISWQNRKMGIQANRKL